MQVNPEDVRLLGALAGLHIDTQLSESLAPRLNNELRRLESLRPLGVFDEFWVPQSTHPSGERRP